MEQKTCPGCHQTKPVEEFNWKCKLFGRRQVRCRSCTREQVKRYYRKNRSYYIKKAIRRNKAVIEAQQRLVLAYLSDHPCVDCGESDIVCLEFDRVRGEKAGNIAHMLGDRSWATIKAEIDKCEVRCVKCHRRKTARQRGWYRWGQANV
jgi:hypothetical protein